MAKNTQDTTAYAEIVKFEEQEDGTVLAYGKATDDTLDSDEQVCDPIWLEKAMPEWFKFGNIREQHTNIAAGVATEYEAKGNEHFITAHIVDPSSAKKVKAGVLKGFSIGIRGARVVKDTKAAGGRIVDGQIVEVSIVDRPANPSCTLIMAKTIGADVVQVEEYTELEGNKAMTATEIIEMAKGFTADTVKFNQAAYDDARRALATLIMVEAGEMAEGSDETYSIQCLLAAVHALMEWVEGEAEEGEVLVPEETEEMYMEMAIEPEEAKAADKEMIDEEKAEGEMCKECGKAMGECECKEKSEEADSTDKCLDCGCHQPANSHGREDVSVAEVITAEEKSATSDNSELRELIAEVVKSLNTSPTVEQDLLTKAAEAERIEALESELAQVKALAAPSGPKRFAQVNSKPVNENVTKAAIYRAKAAATLDKSLADGYRQLAADLEKSI